MLASALGRHVGHGAFEHLEQGLLHALAGNVAGDRDVLAGLADLVDFIDVEDAPLGGLDVEVGRVQELQQQVLHVLAHVAGLGQRGGVADGEGDVENAGQGLGQQGLAGAGGADHEDVRLVDLDLARLGAVHEPLVMAMHGHGQDLLGPLLPDDVLVQVFDQFPGRGNLAEQGLAGPPAAAFLLEDRLAEVDTFAADINVARPLDQRADVAIALAAERAKCVLLGGAAASPASPKITSRLHVVCSFRHGCLLCCYGLSTRKCTTVHGP